MIGIIGAMDIEVAGIEECMEGCTHKVAGSVDFATGKIAGKDVVVAKSGTGKVNAAVCAQMMIDLFDVSCIINTGVAGSLDESINILDIVVSTAAVQWDMDAVLFGYKEGEIPGLRKIEFDADIAMADKVANVVSKVFDDRKAIKGIVASGDKFIASKEIKKHIRETFNASCCEMEGGAIAQCCFLNNTPFVIIRTISDKADGSDIMDYPEFEIIAAKNSVILMKEVLKKL